jgi:hypothetical protein
MEFYYYYFVIVNNSHWLIKSAPLSDIRVLGMLARNFVPSIKEFRLRKSLQAVNETLNLHYTS